MEKVYVVTEEGWRESYGSYTYLIGVFDTLEQAEKVCSVNNYRRLTSIVKNTEHPLEKDGDFGDFWEYYTNDYCLGGYAE